MLTSIRTMLRRLNQPVPRTHPFGEGVVCDGCDLPFSTAARPHRCTNGGSYCLRCTEEVCPTGGFHGA